MKSGVKHNGIVEVHTKKSVILILRNRVEYKFPNTLLTLFLSFRQGICIDYFAVTA